MTEFVTSADGARIGFDRFGSGPPLIVVGGLLCDRERTAGVAEALARQGFTAINYDRRGRGQSTDVPPHTVEREIEDLDALVKTCGSPVILYGHSSGAGLALNAAASGLPVAKLVLHEPPYGGGDETSKEASTALGIAICAALDEERRADAITYFFSQYGLPAQAVAQIRDDPRMLAMAHTMAYDISVMGEITHGGAIPFSLLERIAIPTFLLTGSASFDFFHETARQMAEALPNGAFATFEGDHEAPGEVVAPVVAGLVRR